LVKKKKERQWSGYRQREGMDPVVEKKKWKKKRRSESRDDRQREGQPRLDNKSSPSAKIGTGAHPGVGHHTPVQQTLRFMQLQKQRAELPIFSGM
jgi:hypothetical protein